MSNWVNRKNPPKSKNPAPKTDKRLERASHDGFKPVHREGQWLFKEGVAPKNFLTRKESQAIERTARRRGIKKTNTMVPTIW